MDSNISNEMHSHSTNIGSVPNHRNFNQVPQFIDLTDDGNGDPSIEVASDVIDLINVPHALVQNRTEPNIIDLTEDAIDNGKKTNDESANVSDESTSQNAFTEMSVIVDLTEESPQCPMESYRATEYTTAREIEDCPIPFNRLSEEKQHSNDGIVLDEQNPLLPLSVVVDSTEFIVCAATTTDVLNRCASPAMPVIVDLTEESPQCPMASPRATEYSTTREIEDCPIPFNRLLEEEQHSNDGILLDEPNPLLPLSVDMESTEFILRAATTTDVSNRCASQRLPLILDLTEEYPQYPMASPRATEYSTAREIEDSPIPFNRLSEEEQHPITQVTEDSPVPLNRLSEEEQHSNDRIVLDEQNLLLPLSVVVDSLESLLCAATTTNVSNRCASPMEIENAANPKDLIEELESLQNKISTLENTVVDLNDENDSIFLHIDEYKARACQIYESIKKKTGKSGEHMKSAIKFNGTPFPEFNAKLTRYVNKKKRLPMYENVLKWMKCLSTSNRNTDLTQEECHRLVEKSLSIIGKKLQNQRKVSLSETFAYYTKNQTDPAEYDPELSAKLNRKRSNKK